MYLYSCSVGKMVATFVGRSVVLDFFLLGGTVQEYQWSSFILVDWELESVHGFYYSLKIYPLLLVTLYTSIEFWLVLEAWVPEEVLFGASDAEVLLSTIKQWLSVKILGSGFPAL